MNHSTFQDFSIFDSQCLKDFFFLNTKYATLNKNYIIKRINHLRIILN